MTDPVQRFLDAVAKREATATQGPWTWHDMDSKSDWLTGPDFDLQHVLAVHRCKRCAQSGWPCIGGDEGDHDFISHARTDVPVLLALLRKAIEQRDDVVLTPIAVETEVPEGTVSASWHIHRLNAELAALLPR